MFSSMGQMSPTGWEGNHQLYFFMVEIIIQIDKQKFSRPDIVSMYVTIMNFCNKIQAITKLEESVCIMAGWCGFKYKKIGP